MSGMASRTIDLFENNQCSLFARIGQLVKKEERKKIIKIFSERSEHRAKLVGINESLNASSGVVQRMHEWLIERRQAAGLWRGLLKSSYCCGWISEGRWLSGWVFWGYWSLMADLSWFEMDDALLMLFRHSERSGYRSKSLALFEIKSRFARSLIFFLYWWSSLREHRVRRTRSTYWFCSGVVQRTHFPC